MLDLTSVDSEAREATLEEETVPDGEVVIAETSMAVTAANGEVTEETDQPEVAATAVEVETDPTGMTESQEEEEDVAEATE
jgi:hypothetical protein